MKRHMKYIKEFYGVPAEIGGRVKYLGKFGTIVGATQAHLRIRLDGEEYVGYYHPAWRIEYLEAQDAAH